MKFNRFFFLLSIFPIVKILQINQLKRLVSQDEDLFRLD